MSTWLFSRWKVEREEKEKEERKKVLDERRSEKEAYVKYLREQFSKRPLRVSTNEVRPLAPGCCAHPDDCSCDHKLCWVNDSAVEITPMKRTPKETRMPMKNIFSDNGNGDQLKTSKLTDSLEDARYFHPEKILIHLNIDSFLKTKMQSWTEQSSRNCGRNPELKLRSRKSSKTRSPHPRYQEHLYPTEAFIS